MNLEAFFKPQTMKGKLIKLAATGFGIGFAPVAPGTAGTLAGIPLFFIFSSLSWSGYLFFVACFTGAAVYLAGASEVLFAKKDPPCIVIDEITGFLWTMFFVSSTLIHVLLGFILFRSFDIIKPFPVRRFHDRLPGGYGIVGDDVMAGIYSNLALRLVIQYFAI